MGNIKIVVITTKKRGIIDLFAVPVTRDGMMPERAEKKIRDKAQDGIVYAGHPKVKVGIINKELVINGVEYDIAERISTRRYYEEYRFITKQWGDEAKIEITPLDIIR